MLPDGPASSRYTPEIGSRGEPGECRLASLFVSLGAESLQLFELLFAHGRVVDFEDVDRFLVLEAVGIHADDGLASGVDACLGACRGFFDPQLRNAGFDRLRHAASGFHFLDMRPGLFRELVRQTFDVSASAPGVDNAGRSRFSLKNELGIAGDPS
jgi:hypothetical protein